MGKKKRRSLWTGAKETWIPQAERGRGCIIVVLSWKKKKGRALSNYPNTLLKKEGLYQKEDFLRKKASHQNGREVNPVKEEKDLVLKKTSLKKKKRTF